MELPAKKNKEGSILVIDREARWAKIIREIVEEDYQVEWLSPSDRIHEKIKNSSFNLVVLNIETDKDFSLLQELRTNYSHVSVIATGKVSEKAPYILSRAIKEGAYDFVEKPYTPERISLSIRNAMILAGMKHEIDYLRREQDIIYDFNQIIAVSPSMIEVIQTLKKFAQVDATLLMTGETGTGKSFLAGAVHFNSPRRSRPFIKVNCANIPEQLLESELFGHEKGAFTGAIKTRIGRIEQAKGGTIFLDEIGEMSLSTQTKLLRFLEEKSFERLGSNATIQADVRVIAATNRNLPDMVTQGKFREDLYYRLSVLHIDIPPLRDRKECIIPLARYFLKQKCRIMKKNISDFAPASLEKLLNYHWPGNVRQLANTIERAVILEETPIIQPSSISIEELDHTRSHCCKSKKRHYEEENERKLILETLEKHGWIQKKAADVLGMSPRVLNYKIKKYEIFHPSWRKHKSS